MLHERPDHVAAGAPSSPAVDVEIGEARRVVEALELLGAQLVQTHRALDDMVRQVGGLSGRETGSPGTEAGADAAPRSPSVGDAPAPGPVAAARTRGRPSRPAPPAALAAHVRAPETTPVAAGAAPRR